MLQHPEHDGPGREDEAVDEADPGRGVAPGEEDGRHQPDDEPGQGDPERQQDRVDGVSATTPGRRIGRCRRDGIHGIAAVSQELADVHGTLQTHVPQGRRVAPVRGKVALGPGLEQQVVGSDVALEADDGGGRQASEQGPLAQAVAQLLPLADQDDERADVKGPRVGPQGPREHNGCCLDRRGLGDGLRSGGQRSLWGVGGVSQGESGGVRGSQGKSGGVKGSQGESVRGSRGESGGVFPGRAERLV